MYGYKYHSAAGQLKEARSSQLLSSHYTVVEGTCMEKCSILSYVENSVHVKCGRSLIIGNSRQLWSKGDKTATEGK